MKKFLIRRDLKEFRVRWAGLQETKLQSIDKGVVDRECGRGDWSFVYSVLPCSSGGLLCVWDNAKFKSSECVPEQRFIAVKG